MAKPRPARLAALICRVTPVAFLACNAVAFTAPASAQTTVAQRNEVIVREAFRQWTAGANIFPTLLASDIVWTIRGSGPVAGTYRGRAEFLERASGPLVSRLATPLVPQVHHIWAVGDSVIIRFDASATTTTGQPYRNQFVWILQMQHGMVVEAEAFLDLAAYQRVVDTNPPRERQTDRVEGEGALTNRRP